MRGLVQRSLERRRRQRPPEKCSFCGKSERRVEKLIAGPGVYICDECVEFCQVNNGRRAKPGEAVKV